MRGAGSAPKSNVLSSKAIPVQESRKSKSRKQEKSRGRNGCLQGGESKRILFEESERFSQPRTGFSCHKSGTGVPYTTPVIYLALDRMRVRQKSRSAKPRARMQNWTPSTTRPVVT